MSSSKQFVTLIRPPAVIKLGEIALFATPPIGLAYIAGAVVSHGYACEAIDAVGEDYDKRTLVEGGGYLACGLTNQEIISKINKKTTVIGISCSFTKEWGNYKRIIKEIKKEFPNVIIVCGGEHITAEPMASLKECPEIDYVVSGEGEETFIELLQALENKTDTNSVGGLSYLKNDELIINHTRERIKDIDSISLPAWDLFPIEKYLDGEKSFGVNRGRSMPILASRGCPYSCTFCSSPQMWTTRWVPRDPHEVISEMKLYIEKYRAQNFDFYDLTAIVNRKWILEFCKLLEKHNLNITWQLPSGTRSEAIDDEVCAALYRSGCRNISYSPENASPPLLKRIKKRISVPKVLESIRSALRQNLNVKVNLIFGFPDETHKDIFANMVFIFKLGWAGAHDLSIWSFAPYPGTELFKMLRDRGKIEDFSDEYIASLIYSEMNQEISWNENMSANFVNFYRLVGVLLFYLTSFLTHPQRIVKLFYNILRGVEESRVEKFAVDLFKNKIGKA